MPSMLSPNRYYAPLTDSHREFEAAMDRIEARAARVVSTPFEDLILENTRATRDEAEKLAAILRMREVEIRSQI